MKNKSEDFDDIGEIDDPDNQQTDQPVITFKF